MIKVVLTVYMAVVGQTDSTPDITASNMRIECPQEQRLAAVSRDLLQYISFGDTLYIECDCPYQGEWIVEDKMNKRFTGCQKVDLLIDDTQPIGKWDGVITTIAWKRRKQKIKG